MSFRGRGRGRGRGGFGDREDRGRGGFGGRGGRGGFGGRGRADDSDDEDNRPRIVPKKEKVRDKIDLLVQSIQIGENKKWVSASDENAFTKLMVKALFTKNPKEIQVFIEEKKKGTENKLRTKIKFGDLKWMQIDEQRRTIMILTHLPTPFEIGERGENVRGERTTNWKDAIAVDFQDEKQNPKPNTLVIELGSKVSMAECKERFAKSDPKIDKWLNAPVEEKKEEAPKEEVKETPKEEPKAVPAKKENNKENTKKKESGAADKKEKKGSAEKKQDEKKDDGAQQDKKRKRSDSKKEGAASPAKKEEAAKATKEEKKPADQTEKPKKKKQKTGKQ